MTQLSTYQLSILLLGTVDNIISDKDKISLPLSIGFGSVNSSNDSSFALSSPCVVLTSSALVNRQKLLEAERETAFPAKNKQPGYLHMLEAEREKAHTAKNKLGGYSCSI
jgi:hypothetical protein